MSLEMFIMKCLAYDNSPEMHTIVDKKLKKHYHGCDATYTSSEVFKMLLKSRMDQIDKDPKNLHVYIKEIVDELKLRRRKEGPPEKKIKLDPNSCGSKNQEKTTEEHFHEKAAKKLSKMLHYLQRKIMKLEQKEVDWDEENDSTYIQLQRYKERAVAVYKKLHQYERGKIPKLQDTRPVTYNGTQFPNINRAIEKYVNKTGQFPDYQEVLKLFKIAYEEEKINITPERLRCQAKAAFQNIGEQLKLHRQYDAWNAHSHYLGSCKDPAEDDEELDKKLQENKQEYGNRINEIIDKFAAEAKGMVPEEVPDNETASRSGEDEDEDDESEETNACEGDGEDHFVDEILAGISYNENDSSENEEDSKEDSDGDVGEKGLDSNEVESDNNSSHLESDRGALEMDEKSSEYNKSNAVERLKEAELIEMDEKYHMQNESPKREHRGNVSVCTNFIKVTCEVHESTIHNIAVSDCTPKSPPFILLDTHNGLMQKYESSNNDMSKEKSCQSQQAAQHSKYLEVDTDSDSDIIILE